MTNSIQTFPLSSNAPHNQPTQNFGLHALKQPQNFAFVDETGKKVDLTQGFKNSIATLFAIPAAAVGAATDRMPYALWQSERADVLSNNVGNSTFRHNFANLSRALADNSSISYENLKKIYKGILPALANLKTKLSNEQLNNLHNKLVTLSNAGNVNPQDAAKVVPEVQAEADGAGSGVGGGRNSGSRNINDIMKGLPTITLDTLPKSITDHPSYTNKGKPAPTAYRENLRAFLNAAALHKIEIKFDESTGTLYYLSKNLLKKMQLPIVLQDGSVKTGEDGVAIKLREAAKKMGSFK
jgi:hypothetical protein